MPKLSELSRVPTQSRKLHGISLRVGDTFVRRLLVHRSCHRRPDYQQQLPIIHTIQRQAPKNYSLVPSRFQLQGLNPLQDVLPKHRLR